MKTRLSCFGWTVTTFVKITYLIRTFLSDSSSNYLKYGANPKFVRYEHFLLLTANNWAILLSLNILENNSFLFLHEFKEYLLAITSSTHNICASAKASLVKQSLTGLEELWSTVLLSFALLAATNRAKALCVLLGILHLCFSPETFSVRDVFPWLTTENDERHHQQKACVSLLSFFNQELNSGSSSHLSWE